MNQIKQLKDIKNQGGQSPLMLDKEIELTRALRNLKLIPKTSEIKIERYIGEIEPINTFKKDVLFYGNIRYFIKTKLPAGAENYWLNFHSSLNDAGIMDDELIIYNQELSDLFFLNNEKFKQGKIENIIFHFFTMYNNSGFMTESAVNENLIVSVFLDGYVIKY